MENKLNSVPSEGTEVEKSTNVEATSVSPNDTKPVVGSSADNSLPINIFQHGDVQYEGTYKERIDKTLNTLIYQVEKINEIMEKSGLPEPLKIFHFVKSSEFRFGLITDLSSKHIEDKLFEQFPK